MEKLKINFETRNTLQTLTNLNKFFFQYLQINLQAKNVKTKYRKSEKRLIIDSFCQAAQRRRHTNKKAFKSIFKFKSHGILKA